MKIYYISNPSGQLQASIDFVKAIVAGIESNYPRVDKAGAWALNHRVLRDVPPHSDDARPNYAYSYQHLLHVTTISADRTYNLIQSPAQRLQNGTGAQSSLTPQALIASIPLSQTDAHFALLVNQMPLLWSPQRLLDVTNANIYQAGEFFIHVGELRSRRQGHASNTNNSPGVVVCICTHVGSPEADIDDSSIPADESPTDFEYAQESIRDIWNTIKKDLILGRSEVREYMQIAQDFGRDEEQAREAVVRVWCEALGPRP
ncbi:hypothetical protein N0V90_007748 [Kalmusia sp. IMI 367209]|nr:hypothetical protein N0V90_007748 [Kalmusia sp. IMI 367209]